MIAGGYDKNLDYTQLGDIIIDKVKCIILLGNTSKKIKEAIINSNNYAKDNIKIIEVNTLQEAINESVKNANHDDIVVIIKKEVIILKNL